MDVREKLIELLCESNFMSYDKQADHLIANGVTVQQWIPVTERLPEPFVNVLVFRDGKILIDCHEEDGWFAHDFSGKRATHWMPLPEPPKEDE